MGISSDDTRSPRSAVGAAAAEEGRRGGRNSARSVIGREAFAKISAVEGIALGADMKAAFEDFDRQKLSAAKRRAEIMSRFRREAAE